MRRLAGVLAFSALVGGAGCVDPKVHFVSYKDPYFPERFPIAFDDVRYWNAADGAIEVIGKKTERSDGDGTAHYLHVRIFWKPRPGRTFADATATDATLRYVLVRGGENQTYAGTGFAYLEEQLGGRLAVRIESARLQFQPAAVRGGAQAGAENLLGDMRVSGTLLAAHDPGGGANLAREAQLHAAR